MVIKKNIRFILSAVLIVSFLYGRSYFIKEPVFETEKTPGTSDSVNTVLSTGVPETPKKGNTGRLTFPSRSEPLVLAANTYPPFSMKDENGRWIGADTEITEAVLNRMGYQVQWVDMAFARSLEEMRSGRYLAMMPCVVGGGREDYILFSDPVASIFSVLWKRKTDAFSWSTYDDLKGRVIGASNYHYGAGFFEAAGAGKFELDIVSGKEPDVTHFRKLIQGKIDMFICELSVGLYLRQLYTPEFDHVDYCPTGVGPTRPFCFAVSRKYFKGKQEHLHAFVAEFNEELARFSTEGKRKEILDKYHMFIQMDDQGRVIIPNRQGGSE